MFLIRWLKSYNAWSKTNTGWAKVYNISAWTFGGGAALLGACRSDIPAGIQACYALWFLFSVMFLLLNLFCFPVKEEDHGTSVCHH